MKLLSMNVAPAAMLVVACLLCRTALAASASTNSPAVRVLVLEGGDSKARPEDCRASLVGPGINQLDPFPGSACAPATRALTCFPRPTDDLKGI